MGWIQEDGPLGIVWGKNPYSICFEADSISGRRRSVIQMVYGPFTWYMAHCSPVSPNALLFTMNTTEHGFLPPHNLIVVQIFQCVTGYKIV